MDDKYILGIDLGTTNSVVSFWDASAARPEAIDISGGFGKVPLPSVVQYRPDEDEWVIGEEAFRSAKIYPATTIQSAKRAMGTNATFKLANKNFTPEEISAKILQELLEHARNLNPDAEIAGAVVSVPYDFDDAATKATRRACEMAGLPLIGMIKEPNAAALAYSTRHQLSQGEKIMVFDFGGGTLDITIFEVAQADADLLRLTVISQGGATHHGGDDVDELLTEACRQMIHSKTGQPTGNLPLENMVELAARAREAKERLSGTPRFRIPFTFIVPPFVEQITREDFHKIITPFIDKTRTLVEKSLRDAYTTPLQPEDISRVLLMGGSSAAPWVRELMLDIFSDEGKIYASERPALDISLGAAHYAAVKTGIAAGRDIESEKFGALGQAVEFDIAVPHDIGVQMESAGRGAFFPIIKRGTSYALAEKSHTFTLTGKSKEDMTRFTLTLLERMSPGDPIEKCRTVGSISISGLPPRESGETKLKITLSVDESGMVRGTVQDTAGSFKENFSPERYTKTEL